MRLWERDAALGLLDRLLGDSAAGGLVALVAGEAGLGKSALVTEFVRRSGPRARVLWGGCDRLITPRALGPLRDIGRHTGGLLAERLSARADQEEIFAAFLNELSGPRQRPRPVIVVEDAQWADAATLDWITLLGRRIGRLPALLVITYRDDELALDHPLRSTLSSLPSAMVRRVPLLPLSPQCVHEQALRTGRDPVRAYHLTGGNPLLVTELANAAGQAVPGAVQNLILDRLRALPAAARELAQLVAVVPSRADTAMVAGSAGLDDVADLVDRCIGAGVLVASGDGVSYRHELLRAAVEDALSPPRRAALHQRVLDTLIGIPGTDPVRLVHHARYAGDAPAILRYGQAAAADAARHGAHREAAALYRAAADHAARLSAPRRAELLELYALQAYLAGQLSESLRARRRAAAERQELCQPRQVAENLRWISRLAWWTGQAALAREATDRAVTSLATGPPCRELAMAYSSLAQQHMRAWEHDEAIAVGEQARVMAQELGDAETVVHATINVQAARLTRGATDARAALLEAHERAAAAGYVDQAVRALVCLSGGLTDELGQYGSAVVHLDRALAYAAEHDLDGYLHYLLGARANLRVHSCDWTGALRDADAALAGPGQFAVTAVFPLVARGRIEAARGHPGALATLTEAARRADEIGEPQWMAPVAAARSEYFLWNGDLDRAAAQARQGLARAAGTCQPFHLGALAYRLWQADGTRTTTTAVAEPYQQMINGDWAGAAAAWTARGAIYLRLEAMAAGDRTAASEALRMLDGLGAVRATERLRARLRQRGVTGVPRGPRRPTAAHPAGLTARQAEILTMLADGSSNADIAAKLTLSRKTVEHHISALLGKLGAANRGQAIVIAHRRNLVLSPNPADPSD
ncbi:ATP-binding protein [Actinoplanes ianthinogenes]|uniref:ATP-binding protein n=1 Tax=Actinoplanes ianthinogenes TaxID=122358 RepID=UPI00167022FC|nr:LuxR family transcriptional regulator [Actinoplanes ianthinogenes]